MKKATSILLGVIFVGGILFSACSSGDTKQGKHHSHKGAKKKKSGYHYDFQH